MTDLDFQRTLERYKRLLHSSSDLDDEAFMEEWNSILESDRRFSKLTFRLILDQHADWQDEMQRLETALPFTKGEQHDSTLDHIKLLKQDLKYLEALMAVQYPADHS